MRYYLILVLLLVISGCKENNRSEIRSDGVMPDTLSLKGMVLNDSILMQEDSINIGLEKRNRSMKKEALKDLPDHRLKLQDLLISKKYYKEEDQYVLDFNYPLLNENLDPGYRVYNDFIRDHYVDISETEAQILEDKDWLCDTLNVYTARELRRVDYKIYQSLENLLCVVFYRENYYSGAMHSSYYFDCINFDLENHDFLEFDDVFTLNTEEELFLVINQVLTESIESDEHYIDCWELSLGDFNEFKDNFVIGNDFVEFYFDDCVICPVNTGTFSLKISVDRIGGFLKGGLFE
jgi:hypothetical protein